VAGFVLSFRIESRYPAGIIRASKEAPLRRNNTPYLIKRISNACNRFYIRRFIAPQFDSLGNLPDIAHPRSLIIFGHNIHLGKSGQGSCAPDHRGRLPAWPGTRKSGAITIGNFWLSPPGVRIAAEASIRSGDNVMLAANVYISDSDWHGA